MRVLALTPPLRLEDETLAFLLATRLQVQRGEVGGVRSFDLLLTTDNPHPDTDGGRENILHNYRKGRAVALAGGYDAVLVVESDIVPPPDALPKLVRLLDRADLAYGLYAFRPRDESTIDRHGLQVNVFTRPKGGKVTMKPGECQNTGSPLTAKGVLGEALQKGIIPCSGGGLGLVLIRRKVLEAIDFRLQPNGAHCDTYFTLDAWRAGFEQWADLSVVCAHKTPTGRILWPPLCKPWF
jgi:hypothetical protein